MLPAIFGQHSALSAPQFTREPMKTNRLPILAVAASCLLFNQSAQGEPGALREVWTDVSGYNINDLRELAAYPGEPVVTKVITSL